MYYVIKHDGLTIPFDLKKISAAIERAYQAVRDIDEELAEIQPVSPEDYELMRLIRERKREAKKVCKREVRRLHAAMRSLWIRRNAGAGRSNTSAVSDQMLLTIPTPPTAETAIRSLGRGGVICAVLG